MTKKTSILFITFIFYISVYSKNGSGNIFPFDVDYFNMDGRLFKHSLEETTDSLSNKEILELRDQTGVTLWYSRYFYKDICVSGICRMAKFWIFWDAAGNYLGYQLTKNGPLTKADHVEFLADDYIRLHEILSDTASVLKDLIYEDLALDVDNHEKISIFKIDGLSGATPPSLSGYVIKDAAYTCYTLWHTVYGETKSYISALIKEKINPDYIKLFINGNISQKRFALEFVKQYPYLFEPFKSEFLQMVKSQDKGLATGAISSIPIEYLNDPTNQIQFIELINSSHPEIKNEILYKMQDVEDVSINSILLLLEKYMRGEIGGLNHIYIIISEQAVKKQEIMQNNQLKSKIRDLSSSQDVYVSNLTDKYFSKYYK